MEQGPQGQLEPGTTNPDSLFLILPACSYSGAFSLHTLGSMTNIAPGQLQHCQQSGIATCFSPKTFIMKFSKQKALLYTRILVYLGYHTSVLSISACCKNILQSKLQTSLHFLLNTSACILFTQISICLHFFF